MASVTYNVSKISGKHSVVIRHGSKTLAYKGKFNTKAEAEKFANDFLEMSNTPTKPVLKEIIAVPELNENTTLPLAYKIWRKAFIDKQDLTEATLKKYDYYQTVLDEYFDKPITKITPLEYQTTLNYLGDNVMGKDMLGRVHRVIVQVVDMAKNSGLVIHDFSYFAKVTSKRKVKTIEEKYLHREEDYYKLLAYFEKDFDYENSITPYLLYFLGETGMRYSELVALTWDDIDTTKETLRTYRRYNTTDQTFTPAKSQASVRKVPLKTKDIEILRKIKAMQIHYNDLYKVNNRKNLIFQHYRLLNYVPNSATLNIYFKKALKNCEIHQKLTSYALRHTRASIMIAHDIPVDVAASILGNTISKFDEIYRHLLDEKRDKGFDAIRKL